MESNVVSEFLDRKFPDKGPQLFPSDPKELALVRAVLLCARCEGALVGT